jgi:hypothetical protein
MQRLHNVIILTNGAAEFATQGLLDEVIDKTLALKKNPIVVLGHDGDDILRDCRHIERCDLVFGEHSDNHPLAGLVSGLQATTGGAFALPLKEALDTRALDPSHWLNLERLLSATGKDEFDIARLHDQQGEALYPLAVTATGVTRLKNLEVPLNWDDPHQVIIRCQSATPERLEEAC